MSEGCDFQKFWKSLEILKGTNSPIAFDQYKIHFAKVYFEIILDKNSLFLFGWSLIYFPQNSWKITEIDLKFNPLENLKI